jgi:hypothetical protein
LPDLGFRDEKGAFASDAVKSIEMCRGSSNADRIPAMRCDSPKNLTRDQAIMRPRRICGVILFVTLSVLAPARSFPANLAPLAVGGAPPCSDHDGVRTYRSATVQAGDVSVSIVGTARRDAAQCQSSVSLSIKHGTSEKSYPLPATEDRTYGIVDASPDHTQLLISSEIQRKEPDESLRYIELATMPIGSGQMRWQNVWDLLGWKDCDAMVYPQGFSARGGIVILAQPSVLSPPRRDNCVSASTQYEYDPQSGKIMSRTESTTVQRYGVVSAPSFQSCKADPDLVGACFSVRGRMSAWNGSPTWRISLSGTKHVLGVTASKLPNSVEDVLPASIGKVDWNIETFASFEVCPFTAQKAGAMQMVCVEAASDVTHKPRQ